LFRVLLFLGLFFAGFNVLSRRIADLPDYALSWSYLALLSLFSLCLSFTLLGSDFSDSYATDFLNHPKYSFKYQYTTKLNDFLLGDCFAHIYIIINKKTTKSWFYNVKNYSSRPPHIKPKYY